MRSFGIFFVCLVILTVADCQTLIYYCNFDAGLVGDCVFDGWTGVFPVTTASDVKPANLKPTEPLSDVTSIQSLTTPNNESCIFPYDYLTGNYSMYFCEWNSPTNLTCPTASGIGNCIIGKYAHVRTNTGDFNETYWTNVSTRSNTVHCLDFFYYLTDAFNEAKISFGWQSNETTTTIVELTALSENRWQRSQTTYMSPLSEMNQIWFRMTHSNASFTMFTYALDEIKIFEGSCESIISAIISSSDTVESDIISSQTSEIPTRFTTDVISTMSTAVLDITTSTDKIKLTTDDDVQTTTIYSTTDDDGQTTTIYSSTDDDVQTTTIYSTTDDDVQTTTIYSSTDDDVQTTTIYSTTDEEMIVTTSNTSDVNFTTTIVTSQTTPVTIPTTATSDLSTVSSTKKTDLIVTLGVPLGLGIPALFITVGGLFYHYRKGQLKTKALSSRTNANEIPMTVRNA